MTSSKVTKHADSEDEVTSSENKTYLNTKDMTTSSVSVNDLLGNSVVTDTSAGEDEVTSSNNAAQKEDCE